MAGIRRRPRSAGLLPSIQAQSVSVNHAPFTKHWRASLSSPSVPGVPELCQSESSRCLPVRLGATSNPRSAYKWGVWLDALKRLTTSRPSVRVRQRPRSHMWPYVLQWLFVASSISVRDLRNTVSEVLRRVEGGERLTVTVDRRPVAEIVPLRRRRSVPAAEALTIASRHAADRGLLRDVRGLLADTTDDL